jgi:undecaprenyl-diphosphatase
MLGAGVLAVVLLVVLRGVWRKVVVGLAVFSAVGVGVSRVLLGVHWSSDVLAGWTLGAGCLAVALLLGRRYGVFERAEPGDGAVAGT